MEYRVEFLRRERRHDGEPRIVGVTAITAASRQDAIVIAALLLAGAARHNGAEYLRLCEPADAVNEDQPMLELM